jgi:hypothetical protein
VGPSPHDADVLRRLAGQQAQVVASPVHARKAELWRKPNDLEPVHPVVWMSGIPWLGMDVDGELALQTTNP